VIYRRAVLALLASQHGVATTHQLVQLETSASTIKRACQDGSLIKVMAGVVRLLRADDSFLSGAMALQLRVGDTGYISGASAGFSRFRAANRVNVDLIRCSESGSCGLRT